jgi:hypothetical protein
VLADTADMRARLAEAAADRIIGHALGQEDGDAGRG